MLAESRFACQASGCDATAMPNGAIRPATWDDREALLGMGLRFLAETVYRDRLRGDPVRMATLLERLIGSQVGADSTVLVSAADGGLTGMIGLFVFEHPISGQLTATEAFWWVDEPSRGSAGIRLLRAAQQWAATRGATVLQMIQPDGAERVGRIYEKLGFQRVEVSWQRPLGGI